MVAALLGPVLLGALAGSASDVAVGELVGRVTLVVLVLTLTARNVARRSG